jgi:hypothetical protein
LALSFSFRHQTSQYFIAGDELHLAALGVVIAGIEHGVLNEFGGGPSALAGDLLKLGLHSEFKLRFRRRLL